MGKKITPPKEILAKVLEINIDQLNDNSAYGITPNWDSLNHIEIINELEINYNIEISDLDIEKYFTLKEIIKLYNNLNQ